MLNNNQEYVGLQHSILLDSNQKNMERNTGKFCFIRFEWSGRFYFIDSCLFQIKIVINIFRISSLPSYWTIMISREQMQGIILLVQQNIWKQSFSLIFRPIFIHISISRLLNRDNRLNIFHKTISCTYLCTKPGWIQQNTQQLN